MKNFSPVSPCSPSKNFRFMNLKNKIKVECVLYCIYQHFTLIPPNSISIIIIINYYNLQEPKKTTQETRPSQICSL